MAPDIFETAFRLIAFDWDGTAVTSRADRPTELADAMEQLLMAGVALVVITGTNANNVSGQIAPLLSVEARSRLYLMVNRGSEVYAYDASGELELLYRREPTPEENTALDRTAEAVQAQLRDAYGDRSRDRFQPAQPPKNRPDSRAGVGRSAQVADR